jgi:hypothetical protein
MTNRRLLTLYPKRFRREREEEMVSVLMAGARDGQGWPRPVEVGDAYFATRTAAFIRNDRVSGEPPSATSVGG